MLKLLKTNQRLIIIAVVVIMVFASRWVGLYTEREMRETLMLNTEIGANSIDVNDIKALTGTIADLKSPHYRRLKEQFANICKADPDLHFVYLMGLKGNKIFFYVDDKPDGDKEGSAPGSLYAEAPKEFIKVLKTGESTVEGPSTDSYGSFTSGCAPVFDPVSGKPIAIFAIDFNANSWYWLIFAKAALPVGLMIFLTFGLISHIVSLQRRKLLQESEEKYRVMFDDSPDAYLILKDGIIIDCNRVTEESLCCTREDLIGHSPNDFFPVEQQNGSNSAELAAEKRTEAMRSGRNIFEWILRRKDGSQFWAIVSISKMTLNGNAVLFATWTDISEKIKVEKELITAVEAANAANKAKSEFLANMSHEIRTPLNGVIGFTDLLKNTPLSVEQKQYVYNANASGLTLLAIINDILDFSKIEAGMMHLELIKTDMFELLGQSVDLIKYSATKKNLEVLLDIDPSMPRYAMIDSVRLKQIFANLLGNAVKFTEKGEVKLKVIYQKIGEQTGRFKFSIHDTGIGITPDQKDKLFKAFSQGDSSTTRKFGGTGLGLIISEMIAKKMGSKIEIKSTPGVETIFYFDIVSKTEEGVKLDKESIRKIKRCLVIDDNADNRLIIERLMKGWGIECISCDNGYSAIEVVELSNPFDVIICDYHMPLIDGIDTIKLLREKLNISTAKHPIILLHSSSDNADLHNRCDELNIKYRLTKPVKADELFTFLSSIADPTTEKASEESLTISEIKSNKKININRPVKILIAEDNSFNFLLIKAIMSKIIPNATIIEAKNGKEAVMLWVIEQPELVLMDMQMPEMSGVEATIKIREQEKENQHTPIIALTAGALVDEKDKCLKAGMDDFLTKPIDPKKLENVIAGFLS